MSGGSLHELPATPRRNPVVEPDFPSDTQHFDTSLCFDSPDIPQTQPPGASQPNAPLHLSPTQLLSQPQSKRHSKFGLRRKKDRGRPTSSTAASETGSAPIDDDDEWLLEGMSSNGHVNATVSVGREASALSRSVDTLSLADSDSGHGHGTNSSVATVLAAPAPAERTDKRLSKSRALAKKTSRLFSRNGHHHDENGYNGSLALPGAVRQNSTSSNGSGETSSSRQKHWSLSRVSTKGSPTHKPQADIQPSSWHPPPNLPLRRTPSQSTDTDVTTPVAIPQLRNRDSTSQLSSSVPTQREFATSHSSSPHTQQHHGSELSSTSNSSLPRQDTIPSRMSTWFTNLLPNAATDQSPSALSEPSPLPSSPARKPTGVAASIFSAARNKAVGGMRYLLDSEAQPDHCPDTMWVLGVPHPGYTSRSDEHFAFEDSPAPSPPTWTTRLKEGSGTQKPSSPPSRGGLGNFFSSSFNLAGQASGHVAEPSTPPSDASARSRNSKGKETLKWPDQFYDDFRSRVWCTYRSQYAPIVPLPPGHLLSTPETYFKAFSGSPDNGVPQPSQTSIGGPSSRLSNGPWGWNKDGLTSDAGWGCMLRTGQSLLANALIHHHLGRGWRLPSNKPSISPENPLELAELEAYGEYVRILSWFLDDPSPLCPFSVHRMALIGKELGKEVGEWFGPSTAAGALKTLVNSFPLCGLSVVNAVDGIIYRSDVYAASNISSDTWVPTGEGTQPSRPSSVMRSVWGGKPVLILIGIRLGLDGVNPIYYDTIKTLFTFPYSVGIAGGRPSSSYYFVASQADSLFYLDPHTTRPAVPLRVPPPDAALATGRRSSDKGNDDDREQPTSAISQGSDTSIPVIDVINLDDSPEAAPASQIPSTVTDVRSPSKPRRRRTLTQSLRILPGTPPRKSSIPGSPTTPTTNQTPLRTSQASPSPSRSAARRPSSSNSTPSPAPSPSLPVDPQTAWYASAYSENMLKTYHCDKVKKLPLSGLDPSMLLGFLCQTEAEFDDFCDRVAKFPQKIFAVQDEPPMWDEDDDGLESVSEPNSEGASLSSHDDGPDLELEDAGEFGQITASRPLAVQRDDTITPLNAAASGLRVYGLKGKNAGQHDTHDDPDFDTDTVNLRMEDTADERDATPGAVSSHARQPSQEAQAGDETFEMNVAGEVEADPESVQSVGSEEESISDDELKKEVQAGQPTFTQTTRPVAAAPPPRPPRTHRSIPKGPRGLASEVETFESEEELIIPPPRGQSLSAKTSMASLSAKATAAVDIPRRKADNVEVEGENEGEVLSDEVHEPIDEVDLELASTPSSAPVLVQRPTET